MRVCHSPAVVSLLSGIPVVISIAVSECHHSLRIRASFTSMQTDYVIQELHLIIQNVLKNLSLSSRHTHGPPHLADGSLQHGIQSSLRCVHVSRDSLAFNHTRELAHICRQAEDVVESVCGTTADLIVTGGRQRWGPDDLIVTREISQRLRPCLHTPTCCDFPVHC